MILKPDDTFFDTLALWVFHVRNSLISTPKHLLQFTLFKEIPFLNACVFTVIVAIFCLEPTSMKSIFFIMFNVSLLAIGQFLYLRDTI